jgi:nicotinamide-nucleotide amidase
LLAARGLRLISAESCTGGLLAARLTEVAGASTWFEGSFVTYRLSAKTRMLGVPGTVLKRHGAVSEPTARAMAEGALRASDADLSVAITGIAGPEGGDVMTPVGTVWFGWAVREPGIRCVQTAEHHLAGDRQMVREQAARVALEGVLALLEGSA